MTAPMVDYKIHWLKMMSVPESRAVVGRHDGINGRDSRLDMEAHRLLCDDGRMLPWRPTARKIQRDRRVEGWTATGQDAGSHIRQEGNVPQNLDAVD